MIYRTPDERFDARPGYPSSRTIEPDGFLAST